MRFDMLFGLMEVSGPPMRGVRSLGKSFRAWFGSSKAVNRQGKPLVLFHGTKKPITQFSTSRMGVASNIFGSWENERYGIFLAENPKLAAEFATQGKWVGAQVMPVYLKAEKPLDLSHGLPDYVFKSIEALADDEARASGEDPEDPTSKKYNAGYNYARFINGYASSASNAWKLFDDDEGNDPKDVVRIFKALGYDSVIIHEEGSDRVGNTRTWVAFDPKQIKSALGNKGTFDPDSEDIRESEK